MEMNNDNDRILNIQNNNNLNFFSKVQQDNDEFMINPYDDLNMSCQYSNIKETIENMKNKKGLKIISWNIRSLQANFNQFKDFIDSFNREGCCLDIICRILNSTTLKILTLFIKCEILALGGELLIM